jgi:hypothetical protein
VVSDTYSDILLQSGESVTEGLHGNARTHVDVSSVAAYRYLPLMPFQDLAGTDM